MKDFFYFELYSIHLLMRIPLTRDGVRLEWKTITTFPKDSLFYSECQFSWTCLSTALSISTALKATGLPGWSLRGRRFMVSVGFKQKMIQVAVIRCDLDHTNQVQWFTECKFFFQRDVTHQHTPIWLTVSWGRK